MISSQRSDGAPPPEELGAILGRLTAARTSWLVVAPSAGLPDRCDDVTVIDVTDMRGTPVTVNPFEPEPGCPVQSHIDRLAALFEAAFRPPGPARAALRLGLRRAYADCGWDAVAGTALPGAKAPPGLPSIGGLRRAVLREAAALGADSGQRATIRGFLDVRLGALWTGPAGQFLAAGHPADLLGLTSRNVLFTVGDVADEEAAAFLTGVLLIRLAEQLHVHRYAGVPGAVVLAVPAGRLRRLLEELRGHGAKVLTARYAPSVGGLAATSTSPDSAAGPAPASQSARKPSAAGKARPNPGEHAAPKGREPAGSAAAGSASDASADPDAPHASGTGGAAGPRGRVGVPSARYGGGAGDAPPPGAVADSAHPAVGAGRAYPTVDAPSAGSTGDVPGRGSAAGSAAAGSARGVPADPDAPHASGIGGAAGPGARARVTRGRYTGVAGDGPHSAVDTDSADPAAGRDRAHLAAGAGPAGPAGGADPGSAAGRLLRQVAMSSGPALLGRRSAACGLQCRQRPCSGYELHEAGLLAAADGQVWLRLWAQVLALAFLTGRPLPHVPVALRRTWPSFDVRTRECLLATVVQTAVASRALALRHTYDPRRLEAAVATTAAGLLAAAVPSHTAPAAAKAEDVVGATTPSGGDSWRNDAHRVGTSRYLAAKIPLRAGQVWVIPQLRWLHEVDRLDPLGPRQVAQEDIAPPLDFELAGLPDWPGIRVGDRLDGLRRHRLSMNSERNRGIATVTLLGADRVGDEDLDELDTTGFEADLAIAGIGLGHAERLRYVQRMLGIVQRGTEPGWLEVVSSWPARLIRPGPITDELCVV